MKPVLTIVPAAKDYDVMIQFEITNSKSTEREYSSGLAYSGTLEQCSQYIIDEAHHAGYMEAAKKAINAISDAL